MSNQVISEDIILSHVVKFPFLQRFRRRTRILSASFFFSLFEINFLLSLGEADMNGCWVLDNEILPLGRNFDSQMSYLSKSTIVASGDHLFALEV